MPIRIPWSEVAQFAGQRTGRFIIDLANKALDGACGLYKDFPQPIIISPANSFLRGIWDSACAGRPAGLPAPPAPPFVGGQCPARYSVFGKIWSPSAQPEPATDFDFSPSAGFWGQIGGARVRFIATGGFAYDILAYGRSGSRAPTQTWVQFTGGSGTIPADQTIKITRVVRLDGAADNCGSLPPSYPPATIPPARLQQNITNTYNDGTDFTIPVVFAPVSLAPTINFSAGGINFKFDFGGLEIDLDSGADADLNEIIQRLQNLQLISDRIDSAVAESQELLEEEFKPEEPEEDEDLLSATTSSITGGQVRNIPNLEWVRIHLSKNPEKVQFGNNSPSVQFAGWIEFSIGQDIMPRESISFERSLFKAPPGATGFGFTLTYGAIGSAKYFYRAQA